MSKISGLEVKRELTEKKPKGSDRLALLSGFCRVTLSLIRRGGAFGLSLDCQSDFVRDYIASLMMEQFKLLPMGDTLQTAVNDPSVTARFSQGAVRELVYADSERILDALKVSAEKGSFELKGIDESFRKSAGYYARGVFLGCGSMSVPKAESAGTQKSGGYHLEFSFTTEALANDFLGLLSDYMVFGHLTVRSGKYIVYVKDRESVSDCLALIGAEKTVLKLNEAVATFSVKSDVNRMINAELANMNRTLEAALGVNDAIDIIEARSGLSTLDKKLREAAEARRRNPSAPISRMAAELGISKSGLKHRFDKLVEIARSIEGKE